MAQRACPPRYAHLQAELNSNLHEQVILLREQKELSESKLQKSAAEVKKLNAKVGVRGVRGQACAGDVGARGCKTKGACRKGGSRAAARSLLRLMVLAGGEKMASRDQVLHCCERTPSKERAPLRRSSAWRRSWSRPSARWWRGRRCARSCTTPSRWGAGYAGGPGHVPSTLLRRRQLLPTPAHFARR